MEIQKENSPKRIAVIGSGISGIAAASYAAQAGNEVHVFEKNDQPGGRGRQFKTVEGYVFDMGPSWYWMPDLIESFFEDFGHKVSDFYQLVSLDPQFEMVFDSASVEIPQSYDELKNLFESYEKGAANRLDDFMKAAKYKYEVGMKAFVYKPCYSWTEFISKDVVFSALKMDLLSNFRSYVAKYFSNPKLRTLMEFPVIFLGAAPQNIPALYSLMNYGGYVLGTHYPMGGFYELILGMIKVAEEQGVKFHYSKPVDRLVVKNKKVVGLEIEGNVHEFDVVIASSDYHHTDTLLDKEFRNYDEKYWESRTFAPSCLIFYLGFNEKIPNLHHHTLFFEYDLDKHINEIYKDKKWPDKPLFYVSCPSKTDPSVAPEGHENIFLLMPLAIGLDDNEDLRNSYLSKMLKRIEKHTGATDLESKIDYKKSYCVSNFVEDYNAYKGNAYGLANTLKQTAVWKPSIRNKNVSNLFYTGQLTVPGPGVPPSLISGKIVATEVNKLK